MVLWPTPASTTKGAQTVVQTPSVSNAWQLGTILKAMALSDSVEGRVQLQIGARVVTAQTSLPLQSGQTLRLQVAETGRTVILRSVGELAQNDSIRNGIRENLPRQMPQAPLLAATLSLARASTGLPTMLTEAVQRLSTSIRDAGTVTTGQGLRLAVRDSGNFLEHRLATALDAPDRNTTAALPRDWKAALLRFRDQLVQLQVKIAGDAFSSPSVRSGRNGPVVANTIPAASGVTRTAPATLLTVVTNQVVTPPNGPVSVVPNAAQAIGPVGVLPVDSNASGVVTAGLKVASLPPAGVAAALSHFHKPLSANAIPPPMRHALPQPQPLGQHSALPVDALNLIGDLISGTDGALARVRLNQLASVTPDQSQRLVWLLELPVRHSDDRTEVVTMRIENDEEGNEAHKKQAWTADLAFDLGAKGQLRARVALRAGRVSVSFWADADPTRTEVQDKLPQLKTAMEKKQLDVATLSAGAGQPPQPPAPSASLLETQA